MKPTSSWPTPESAVWPLAETVPEAQDDLENVACLIGFLSSTLATGRDPSGDDLPLDERGQHGLWLVFNLILEHLDAANAVISKINPAA